MGKIFRCEYEAILKGGHERREMMYITIPQLLCLCMLIFGLGVHVGLIIMIAIDKKTQ